MRVDEVITGTRDGVEDAHSFGVQSRGSEVRGIEKGRDETLPVERVGMSKI